jgi:transcriptional regulator with XRE-family HTH domain
MNAKQFRTALERLGLSQSEVAELFDYDERTVRRWAAEGCTDAPAILMHLLDEGRLILRTKIRPSFATNL